MLGCLPDYAVLPTKRWPVAWANHHAQILNRSLSSSQASNDCEGENWRDQVRYLGTNN